MSLSSEKKGGKHAAKDRDKCDKVFRERHVFRPDLVPEPRRDLDERGPPLHLVSPALGDERPELRLRPFVTLAPEWAPPRGGDVARDVAKLVLREARIQVHHLEERDAVRVNLRVGEVSVRSTVCVIRSRWHTLNPRRPPCCTAGS